MEIEDRGGVLDRLQGHIRRDESGCWLWTRRLTTRGYGQTSVAGRKYQAHRAVYELLVGPIPEGLQLDHLCRERSCVNPAHLEPVTQRENVLRGAGVAAANAKKTHCVRGHPLAADNVVVVNTGRGRVGRRCRKCQRATWGTTRPQSA